MAEQRVVVRHPPRRFGGAIALVELPTGEHIDRAGPQQAAGEQLVRPGSQVAGRHRQGTVAVDRPMWSAEVAHLRGRSIVEVAHCPRSGRRRLAVPEPADHTTVTERRRVAEGPVEGQGALDGEVAIGRARYLFDDDRKQRVAGIRVQEVAARFERQLESADRGHRLVAAQGLVIRAVHAGQPTGVQQQLFDGRVGHRSGEIGHQITGSVVQRQLAHLGELEDRGRGHALGDRANVEHRVDRVRFACRLVRHTVSDPAFGLTPDRDGDRSAEPGICPGGEHPVQRRVACCLTSGRLGWRVIGTRGNEQ